MWFHTDTYRFLGWSMEMDLRKWTLAILLLNENIKLKNTIFNIRDINAVAYLWGRGDDGDISSPWLFFLVYIAALACMKRSKSYLRDFMNEVSLFTKEIFVVIINCLNFEYYFYFNPDRMSL